MLKKKIQKTRVKGLTCLFCQSGKKPDYKDVDTLKGFVSDWGKIVSRTRTGTCAKHQRRLTKAIKRARYLGLVSFTTQI